jgi:hypothetical protein
MQTLTLNNFGPANLKEQTRLSHKVAAGANALPSTNVQGFSTGDLALVGLRGDDASEIVTIDAGVTTGSIPITSPLKREHVAFEYVTKIFGDKIRIYRASNVDGTQPGDGAFTLLTTADIDFDQMATEYTDNAGGAGYWYKFTYFNSATSAETAIADSNSARGGGSENYVALIEIRKEAGFEFATYISDEDIDTARQTAQAEVNGALSGVYTVPFKAPVNAWVVDITKRLAAGLLLKRQYGTMSSQSNINGASKIKEARADLMNLANKQSVLTSVDGTSIALPGSVGGVGGWPDDSTAEGSHEPRQFSMRDIHGYNGRKW